MNKALKKCLYMLCVCTILVGFGACKSKPDSKPEMIKPAQPENSEGQETVARLLKELEKARSEAIEAKADKAYPAEFKSADDTATEAKQKYAANDFASAQAKAQKAIAQYRTLINQVRIAYLKAKIDEHDLSSSDAENYRKGEELSAKIAGLYESDTDGAFKTSVEALNCYEAVANAGFASLLEDAKKKADEARAACDSVKAAAAMKDAYEKTVNRYRYAGIAAGNKKYEQAYTGYMTAANEFNDIYEKVKIKRAQANDAMERAKARQEASSQLAKDADREAPLPEDAEGFSEEPIEVETLQLSEKSDSSDTEVPAMESDSSAAEGGN